MIFFVNEVETMKTILHAIRSKEHDVACELTELRTNLGLFAFEDPERDKLLNKAAELDSRRSDLFRQTVVLEGVIEKIESEGVFI